MKQRQPLQDGLPQELFFTSVANMAPRQEVIEIFASKEEIAAGKLNDANIRRVLEGMHHDGIIVLRDLIDPAHLDALDVHMVKEAKMGLEAGVKMNQGAGNIQQGPPFTPTNLFFDDIYCNKILHHAVSLYLGKGAKWNLVTGNTALPQSTKRQPVHSDADFQHPDCPFYCVANIPLITSEVATGATEIWLGGQHRGNVENQAEGALSIREDLVEARRKVQPPVQPTVPKGSIMLRDLRLWHAGMPNPSDQFRCMVALGFAAPWYHNLTRFRVPADTEVASRIEEGMKGSEVVAKYRVCPQGEYAASRFAFDFTFEEDKEDDEVIHVNDKIRQKAAAMLGANGIVTGASKVDELGRMTTGISLTA
jgi:ectoine hydroxylase-related dioxygenase (phytanoyl-CoA dioxygenase family)